MRPPQPVRGPHSKKPTEFLKILSEKLPAHEAEWILTWAFWKWDRFVLKRLDLFQNHPEFVPDEVEKIALEMLDQRLGGVPLQYASGWTTFLDHAYQLTRSVLIPRPETECLVVAAFEKLKNPQIGIEIGLGSGIITCELLLKYPDLQMAASEVSLEAQDCALRNIQKYFSPLYWTERLFILNPDRRSEVIEPFETKCMMADFIISNPPYLLGPEECTDEVLMHEPRGALFAPKGDPLHYYREIAQKGLSVLKKDGLVLLEIPHERSQEIVTLFEGVQAFGKAAWKNIEIRLDLNSRPRVLIANRV